jgi:hypothetical protein
MRSALLCLVLVACDGTLIGGLSPSTPGSNAAPTRPAGPPATVEPGLGAITPPDGPAWPIAFRGAASPLRRLTRDELVTSFLLLTGDSPRRDELPTEAQPHHQPLITVGKPLRSNELATYSFVVEAFAARVAPTMLLRTGCAPPASAMGVTAYRRCLEQWATTFADKVLRRSPRADEETLLAAMLAGADGTPLNDRTAVASVLTALFLAPSFLYRSEVGVAQGTARVLSGPELATRLSYLATLGPPDDALLADAAAGRLLDADVRLAHYERLRTTPRGERALAVMLLEWLGASEQKLPTKSDRYLAGLPAGLETELRASAEAAIVGVLRSPRPTVAQLFSTESYLADPAVTQVTRAAGTNGDSAGTRRGGLLMHPHVLAANTKENGPSPFQLGSMLKEAVLCELLPPPPAGATTQARADVPPGASLREIFEHRTNAAAACTGCHALFAPLGYAFLPFDPAGRWQAQDASGKPWSLSGSTPTFSGELTFTDPRELSEKLGASRQVHGCLAQFSASWVLGRGLMTADQPLVDELDATVKRSGGDVLELMRALVRSSTFVAPPPAP